MKEIQQLSELADSMQDQIYRIKEDEIIPLSFFSQSYDTLKRMNHLLHVMEEMQIKKMQAQFLEHKEMMIEEDLLLIKKEEEISQIEESDSNEDAEVLQTSHVEAEEEKTEQPVKEKYEDEFQHYKEKHFFHETLEKKLITDLRKAISLNDRFRFQRELFAGNVENLNRTLDELNKLSGYEEAISYIENNFQWDIKSDAAKEFIILIKRRFE